MKLLAGVSWAAGRQQGVSMASRDDDRVDSGPPGMGPADLPRQEGGGLDVVVLSILQHLVLLTGGQLGQRRVHLSPFGPGGQQKMETVDQRVATAARVGWQD